MAWFDRFGVFLLNYGFYSSLANYSLFTRHSDQGILVLLLYVDDMLITGSSSIQALTFLQQLKQEFAIKGLSDVHSILSVEITKTPVFLVSKAICRDLSQNVNA